MVRFAFGIGAYEACVAYAVGTVEYDWSLRCGGFLQIERNQHMALIVE